MRQTRKIGKLRRRLMTGLFCISLFAADVTAAIPVWASEPAAEQAQGAGEETAQPVWEDDGSQAQSPDEEKAGEGEQNPDGKKDGENMQNPEEGKEGDNAQNPGEGKDGDNVQNPDDGKAGDAPQNPDDGKDGEDMQDPENKKDEDGAADNADDAEQEPETPAGEDAPDGEQAPDTDDQESVSENDPEEQEPSVSENDMEVLGEVRALAVPADAIAYGSYKDVTWVIDADGKLTVEGSGDFCEYGGIRPWYGNKNKIKSAVIKLKNTTSTQEMFSGCSNLTEIDMSEFDTSHVTNMHGMFQGCQQLKSLDFSNFDTSHVTDMSWMFRDCGQLKSLDFSEFDTSHVTNMSYMFYNCRQLKGLDFSDFDTAAVTTMKNMFYGCWGLTELDLSGFQTDNVNNMVGMFNGCSELTGLDLNSFNTANVSDMSGMFENCKKMKSLKIDRFDTGNVTSMYMMFDGCSGLTSLDVSSFNTGNVTNMGSMFNSCSGLTSLDVSNFDTGNVTDMGSMFSNCVGMDTIDLSSFDTGKATNMTNMFYTGLIGSSGYGDGFKQLDLSSFDTGRVTGMSSMFEGQKNLIELNLSSFDTSQVTDMRRMFMYCQSLPELNLSSFDTGKVTDLVNMFYGCSALKSLDLSHFNLETHTVGTGSKELGLFSVCRELKTLYTPYNLKEPLTCLLSSENTADVRTIHWYDVAGTEYQYLPHLDYSILLQRDQKPAAVQSRITVRKTKTAYACGETINVDDLTVTCYGADGSVKKLTADQYTTNAAQIDMTEAGEKKLIVTYVNGGTSLTAEITLTVTYGLTADNTTVTLPAEADGYIYDGQPKQPVLTAVSYTPNAAGGTGTPVTLTAGTDYTVSYRNNINAYEKSAADDMTSGDGTGTAASSSTTAPTVIIKGMGNYSGRVTKTFAIGKAAAPAAETMDVIGSQCAQADPKRTADLTGSFRACGKKTGYEVLSVEDPKGIFSQTPVTADIKDGVLTYGTKAAQEGDTASIRVKVSFQNYQDAELTVKITMAAKKAAVIFGITMEESVVYSGVPVSYEGEAVVKTQDGKDITGQVTLVYRYSGTMADGTAYPAQGAAGEGSGTEEAPVNAGSYTLTVSISDDNTEYTGSAVYPFTIGKAEAFVTAKDLTVLMKKDGGMLTVGADKIGEYVFGYRVTGLFGTDSLKTEPSYTVTEDEAGTKSVTAIDISKAGTYYIHPSGADAGMNYEPAYRPGILTVSEERVAYTVTLDGMGHCDTFTKSGIRSGALLELTEEERTPAAKEKGYVFAGWYRDQTFAKGKEWKFDTDTVQADLTLYACWLTAAGEDGDGLKLCVQEIPNLTYTGSALKPAVTVYDGDGETLLKAGKDYTVKYANNTNAVAVDENGKPKETGGTAKVVNPGKTTDVTGKFTKDCPYVIITGKGNYKETIYRNFLILPAQISGKAATGKTAAADAAGQTYDTPLAVGFTLKYTDQLAVNGKKEQKPFGSMKYKKAMKAGKDFTVTLGAADEEGAFDADKKPLAADWKAEGTLNAKKQYTLPAIPKGYSGAFTLTVTGKGNYAGTVTRKLYVSDKQNLMKNAAITLGKNQKTFAYTGEAIELTPGYYDAATKKYHKVTAEGVVSGEAEADAKGMFLVKAGKNGKAGGESLVWGRDYTIDYAGTNRAAGTATMTLTGKNSYAGTKSVTFKITGAKFTAKTINVKAYDGTRPSDPQEDAFRASMPYTGRALTQNKVVLTTKETQGSQTAKELVYGEHYTIAYRNNVKKGTATVTFTAKPESGYSGSFKKTFKITAQELSKERFTVTAPTGAEGTPEAVYSKNGAKLSLTVSNEAGTVLREGTDYTVKYKNNKAVTTAQTADNKKPLLTVTGKGSYAGTVDVPFTIVQASLADALQDGSVTVSCAQVQKKNGMKLKDFKLKLMEGKKTLVVGETKDYVIDETKCTPEIISAYADALAAAGTTLPQEPAVKVTGKGGYAGGQGIEIPLGRYIYAEKLTAANLYVVVSEGAGQSVYTGRQVTPDVAVYYGDKKAVSAAKTDKEKDEAKLTAQNGKYKLTKLARKSSENAGDGENVKDGDYTVSYGANVQAGKNKGSVTVTGAGRYGGSVTVKFEIAKKAIY